MPSPPKIHFVRHAQGFHNLGDSHIRDPNITPLGENQCAKLQEQHFPPEQQHSISLITSSPLTRTLQTAFLTFKPALTTKGAKCDPIILAIPDAQETSDYPCDTGSDIPVLQALIKKHNWPVDISLLTPAWNIKTMDSRNSPTSPKLILRAIECRKLLREKARELANKGDEDVEIICVTHGGYLHYLTEDWEDAAKFSGTGWENTEYRTFEFANSFLSDTDEAASLKETMPSRARRGIDYPQLDAAKQDLFFKKMLKSWEDQDKLNAKDKENKNVSEQHGQQPADLERQVTKAADEAEKTVINTQAQSVKVTA
ncbi:hypothetical protein H2200_007296 [Cladophialophora chaetospira]|uniref:Phosphoglycerate mutase family protein n=1 Tax=Cladophialophora chaetospira TaxID=386627 RepID=A0AA39CHI7_9EURO|nr:hypothetical protein H2200_007296 [Cladophialophora chaetospira]